LSSNYADRAWLGVFGNIAEISCSTIWYYITAAFGPMWLFSKFPFELDASCLSSPISYQESNEFHVHINTAGEVLIACALEIGFGKREELFPDIDMSIFAEDQGYIG
jgi:hypothetical protein